MEYLSAVYIILFREFDLQKIFNIDLGIDLILVKKRGKSIDFSNWAVLKYH